MLLSAFAGTAMLILGKVHGFVGTIAFYVVVPVSLFVFLVALAIGHFLADPLHELERKIKAYRSGDTSVSFEPEEKLYEADALASDFKDLLDSSAAQCADLARRETQQNQFVSDVAHELRTPLTAIHGDAELMMDPDMPPAMREHFCTTIVSESERLSRLVNDLLSIQHIKAGDQVHSLARVNLKPIAQAAIDALAPVLSQRQANVELVGEAPDVLGDADRLKQVVNNLVDNASRFIEPGGHIRVELYGVKDNSVIAVKDDGTGFGDTDPKLLFERFFRTDESRSRDTGGSGLGLAIVKEVVEAHDGTVEAFNLSGGGACFVVAIPSLPPVES